MLRIVRALLLATAIVAGTLPESATATPLFVLDTDEATYTLLHRVNPQTGQLIPLGELPAQEEIVALAALNDNLLYAVAYSGTLLRITVSPFGFAQIGDVGPNRIVGLAYGNGALYGIDETLNALVRIDPATAALTVIGTIRLADGPLQIMGGDIVQAPDGNWFLWTNANVALYSVDIGTGLAAPVPDQAQSGWYSGLAFDHATGRLYASAVFEDLLVETDPRTGAALADIPFCVDCPDPHDLAFGDMASARCTDADRDGFFGQAGCGLLRDCDDTNAAVNPLARETCNGRDDDCDTVVDDGASSTCNDNNACTIGDSCQAGACRPGRTRDCGPYRLLIRNPTCRSSDGACCGRLYGLLSFLTVCLR
jgi:hypothetical protein